MEKDNFSQSIQCPQVCCDRVAQYEVLPKQEIKIFKFGRRSSKHISLFDHFHRDFEFIQGIDH